MHLRERGAKMAIRFRFLNLSLSLLIKFFLNREGSVLEKKEYNQKFYLVREDVLPEAMKKTLDAKELLDREKLISVWDAVQQVDLSRSAFYKYRDTVFPFHRVVKEKIISLFFYPRR